MIISSLLFRVDSDAHKPRRMTILGKKSYELMTTMTALPFRRLVLG